MWRWRLIRGDDCLFWVKGIGRDLALWIIWKWWKWESLSHHLIQISKPILECQGVTKTYNIGFTWTKQLIEFPEFDLTLSLLPVVSDSYPWLWTDFDNIYSIWFNCSLDLLKVGKKFKEELELNRSLPRKIELQCDSTAASWMNFRIAKFEQKHFPWMQLHCNCGRFNLFILFSLMQD